MSNALRHTQDIKIKEVIITTSSGQQIDFKNMVLEFNYFEDIFSNGISGTLFINDSMGYIEILQLHGSEVLSIKLDKPGLHLPIVHNFRIYGISNRLQTSATNENYLIKFYSEELHLNEQYRVSKSYPQATISNIVENISDEYLKIPKKRLIVDKTTGLRDIVVPNFKPIQTINWLTTFAIPDDPKNIGSPFLFYEDRDGWNFKSILTLFQQPIYQTYEYSAKGLKSSANPNVTDMEEELVNVIQYEHIKDFDMITAVRSGAFANRMHTVDPLRLKLGEKNFNYLDYRNSGAATLNKHEIPTTATNRFGDTINDTPGVVKFCMTTTGQSENPYIKSKSITINENRIEETVPYRTAQIALFLHNRVKLLIPGDVYMKVGRVIKFNMPEISYKTKSRKKQKDDFYSGVYLVTAVRHIFNQEEKFITCIEICKESFPTKHGAFNNSDPDWLDKR